MTAAILPLPLSMNARQLPDPARRLSSDFVKAFGRPAGLWTPSKLKDAAADFSGNRNFGTLTGGVTTTASGWGTLGQSWKFDGSTGQVALNPLIYRLTDNFSFWCVFIATSTLPTFAVISFNGVGGANGYGFVLNNASLNVLAEGVTFTTFATGYTVTVGTPVLAAFSRTSGTNSLYANGALIATSTQAFNTPGATGETALGGEIISGSLSRQFGGYVLASAWNSAPLTAAQVSDLYNSLLYGQPFRLFAPSAIESFVGSIPATGGLLLARRRAAAA